MAEPKKEVALARSSKSRYHLHLLNRLSLKERGGRSCQTSA